MEQLDNYFFNSSFSDDYGNLDTSIPLLSWLDDKEPFSKHCCIDFSTYLSNDAQEIPIYDLTTPIVLSSQYSLYAYIVSLHHTAEKYQTK